MIIKNQTIILGETRINECAYCGREKDLRPYGKNKAMICFDCGMKPENKEMTDCQFNKLLDSVPATSIIAN